MTTLNLASLVDNEAELSVLGGILVKPELLPLLVEIDVDCFSDPHRGHVFGAMRNLEAKGLPIDVVTVADQLERDGHVETPLTVLGEAALRVPTPDNLEHYAKILVRHRLGRDLEKALHHVRLRLVGGLVDGPDALLEAQDALGRLESVREGVDRGKTIGAIVRELSAEFESGEAQRSGISSGLSKLDAKTGGIPFGIPTLILAPPGAGKTTLSMTLCEGAERAGDTPLIYSYEDGHKSFGQRALARHTGVPTEAIRSASFCRDDLTAIGARMHEALKRRAVVIRASGMTVEELARDVRSRRIKHKGNGTTGRLVVVDYVQRMPLPSMHGGTKNDRIGEISRRLADLAATEDIAVVVNSQVGRQVPREQRPPILQDARDCGELENDAKLALGLYRPSVYGKPRTGEEGSVVAPSSVLEIHILKNHQGAADCHVEAYWDLETHAIVDSPMDLAARRRA